MSGPAMTLYKKQTIILITVKEVSVVKMRTTHIKHKEYIDKFGDLYSACPALPGGSRR
jgi:hypothetical protein